MKHPQLQFDTRFTTASKENLNEKREQRKAAVKHMLQTDCQPCNPVHDEPVPHEQLGWDVGEPNLMLQTQPPGPVRPTLQVSEVSTGTCSFSSCIT